MITPESTWGGLSANAYAPVGTVDEIITTTRVYFDEWGLASDEQKQASIYMATEDIDSRVWSGRRYFPNQTLAFPRIPDGYDLQVGTYNQVYPDDNFQQLVSADNFLRLQKDRVIRATAYQALFILKNGGERADAESQFQGLAGVSMNHGFGESRSYREPSFVLCPESWNLLRWYKGATKLVRGGSYPGVFDSH